MDIMLYVYDDYCKDDENNDDNECRKLILISTNRYMDVYIYMDICMYIYIYQWVVGTFYNHQSINQCRVI